MPFDPELPFLMKDKIGFLRKCFSRLRPLKAYRKEMLRLLDKISDQNKKVRVPLVHGAISDCRLGRDSLEIAFKKLDGGGDIHRGSTVWISVKEIADLAKELLDLSNDLANKMVELSDAFVPENSSNNPRGYVA